MTRKLYVGPIFLGLLAALGVGSMLLEKRAAVEAAAVCSKWTRCGRNRCRIIGSSE